MASQYDINLSNGNVLATLYPLEFNGPDNRSTPRLTQKARPTFQISVATPGTNTLSVVGDETLVFRVGFQFQIVGSTGNDGTHTVQSVTFSGGDTILVTSTNIASAVPDGVIIAHVIVLAGDISGRLIAGYQFDVSNSGQIDATYTTTALGAVSDGQKTVIPVTHGTIRDNINTPIALPYGSVDYINTDSNTALKLPGRGVVNYGEMIVENMVRMTENFASDLAPNLNGIIGTTPVGDPLTGQQWYRTITGQEGFHFYDGTDWSNELDIDDGALVFRDPQNALTPNTDIYVTADESGLPVGYTGTDEAGMVVWTAANPNVLSPIFRVLSTDGSERIRIEHDGWIRTTNNLEVVGGGNGSIESYFHGKVGIGSDGLPTIVNTLTVEGNGITVNSGVGLQAEVELNAPIDQESVVNFDIAGTRHGNISVVGSATGNPLNINSTVANHVQMVSGGGNVGIDTTANPTATLQIRENIYFNEGNGNATVGPDIRCSGDGVIVADNNISVIYEADGGVTGHFDVRSGTNSTTGSVVQMYIDNDKMYVDTDTLYINTAADRVGVNMVPAYPLDVTGSSRFNSPVGINSVPPSGTPVWVDVGGDIQTSTNMLTPYGSAASPPYTFTADGSTGMFATATSIGLSFAGVVGITVDATRVLTDRVNEGVKYTFVGDTSTAIAAVSIGQMTISSTTNTTLRTAGVDRFTVEVDGTLSSNTASYEALVTAPNDIPNKAYVDDRSVPSYEEYVGVGGESILNTTLKTTANTATRATLQVFLNGLLQMEGAAKNYTVTGANQITFTTPLVAADNVVLYAFER